MGRGLLVAAGVLLLAGIVAGALDRNAVVVTVGAVALVLVLVGLAASRGRGPARPSRARTLAAQPVVLMAAATGVAVTLGTHGAATRAAGTVLTCVAVVVDLAVLVRTPRRI